MKTCAALRFTLPLLVTSVLAQEATEWRNDSNQDGVLIQSRTRAGSPLREFRAVGIIEAPTRRVFAVLNDADRYPSFMPYVSEVRVLRREPDAIIFYQRLKLPLVHDRDFTLRTRFEEAAGENGTTYRMRWQPVGDVGPAPMRGVVRVTLCDGGWLLEPVEKSKTRATYTIYTDSGGAFPSFIANTGSRVAIHKLFAAVRKEAGKAR